MFHTLTHTLLCYQHCQNLNFTEFSVFIDFSCNFENTVKKQGNTVILWFISQLKFFTAFVYNRR